MSDQYSYPVSIIGYDADYWRKRVRMTLEKASCSEARPKERLLRVAREYERMAQYAETKQACENNRM